MNTKIVYVVRRKSDYYVEMLRLSLASLRLYHPNDSVEIVMDDETYLFLTKKEILASTKCKGRCGHYSG